MFITPNCTRKLCYFLLIMYMEEASQKVKTDEILTARAICNLHSCYMKNALVFSQSDVRNYFQVHY